MVWRRLSSTVCIVLLIGVAATTIWLTLQIRKYAATLRSSYSVTAVLRDSLSTAEGDSLVAVIQKEIFADSTAFLSAAAREAMVNDSSSCDSTHYTAADPLPALITVRLTADAAQTENLPHVKASLMQHPEVSDVLTAPDMLQLEADYIPKVVLGAQVLTAAILLVVILLLLHSLTRLFGRKKGENEDKPKEDGHNKGENEETMPHDEAAFPEDA